MKVYGSFAHYKLVLRKDEIVLVFKSLKRKPLPARNASQSLGLHGGRVAQIMNYTYVLKSIKDSKLYIGWTNNLKNRILEHDNGHVTATKDRRPLKLIYYEACLDREKAIEREKYFKTGFGRRFLKDRV
jgi:putative endonuclease